MDHGGFVPSPVDGHLGSCVWVSVVTEAAVNTPESLNKCFHFSWGRSPGEGSLGHRADSF